MRWLRNNKGNLGSLFGGKKSNPYDSIKLPDFQVDSSYQKSQDTLSGLGENILQGNIPDYYKPIGDFNSDAFKQLINNVSGQINQGVQESAAIGGTGRSGTATAASGAAMSNILPQLQYSDYTRALEGRGALLNTGIGVEQGVRSAGQAQEGMLNNFNLANFDNQMALTGKTDAWDQQYGQQKGSAIGSLLNGVAGGVSGFMTGGPWGALAGGIGGLTGQSSGIGSLLPMLGNLGKGGQLGLGGDQTLGAFGGGTGGFSTPAQSFFKNFKLGG